jgi:hypothetical protein
MLLQTQNPGTTYAATAKRWRESFRRVIRPGARPLAILQPGGPVMFVFDVSDTESVSPDAPALPRQVTHPFEVSGSDAIKEFTLLTKNASRDGVYVTDEMQGSARAGHIAPTRTRGKTLSYFEKFKVPRRYDIVLNAAHSFSDRYATLVHELAHLYCGHIGIPFEGCQWWPNRMGMDLATREFEAESVAYLVCKRLGLMVPSAKYLSGYLGSAREVPPISLDRILVVAGLVERMSKESMPPNRPPKRLEGLSSA